MNWYKRHLGDWSRDTSHLSILESGAYDRLIAVYYRTEKPLPLNLAQLCRLAGCRTPQDRNAVKSVIAEFFTEQSDGYHQKRCEEEIAHMADVSDKARQSIMARWDKLSTGKAIRTYNDGNSKVIPPKTPVPNKDLDLDLRGPIHPGGNGKGQTQHPDDLPVNVKTLDPPDIERNRAIAQALAEGNTNEAERLRKSP